MSFVNNYTPQPDPLTSLPESELYGPEPYDINFAWPLHPSTLETPRLALVPFVPRVHAATYWAHIKDHLPTLFRYYPFLPRALPDFLAWLELVCRRNPHHAFFAVIDKTRAPDAGLDADSEHAEWGGSLAGAVALCNTSPGNLSTELGYVIVFPQFQHTHVAKDMVAILLRYLLALPTASPPGLGFRRVQWCAHPENAPSVGLAERMGFRREGTLRWLWVLPDAENMGDECTRQDKFEGKRGRHSAVLSVCWDDWEGGVGEKVKALLEQK